MLAQELLLETGVRVIEPLRRTAFSISSAATDDLPANIRRSLQTTA
jgi:hypothetical protein